MWPGSSTIAWTSIASGFDASACVSASSAMPPNTPSLIATIIAWPRPPSATSVWASASAVMASLPFTAGRFASASSIAANVVASAGFQAPSTRVAVRS